MCTFRFLVYLSNAVAKVCKEGNFIFNGLWYKWGSYGFEKDGRLRFEEYYPNALEDTYKGIKGYICNFCSTLTDDSCCIVSQRF